MRINRNNYEIYFLDYRENQLTPGEVADLMLFLEQNQDLKSEFDEFENISIKPDENITFEAKGDLKKQPVTAVNGINAENYEEYLIASIEKELKANEETNLVLFLKKNTFLQKEYELFKLSILSPDRAVVFPDKSSLYKKAAIISWKPALYYATSAAAVILLFFSIYLNIDAPENKENIIAQAGQGSAIVEDSVDTKKAEKKEQVISPSKEDNSSGIRTIINRNPHTKQRSLKAPKRKTDVSDKDPEQIKKIKITSVELRANTREIVTEDRDYIYDVFRNSNVDDIQYADTDPATDDSKTLLGFALSKFKDVFRNKNHVENQPENITFWDIADVGISGFNTITRSDIQLNREYNSEGKISTLALVSDGFEVYRRKAPKQSRQ
ncbi:MAG: hypothetical protein K8S00_05440 [Bacteroidales bacterium]|nr:hypothetical protein [Bacteroidales bacterium]